MAMADYRLCDVCGNKAFYDSNLNYCEASSEYAHGVPYRIAGDEQYDKQELVKKYGQVLDRVGDWAVLCNECSLTHKVIIQKIEANHD